MALIEKPRSLEFGLIDDHNLSKIVASFSVGPIHSATGLVLEGNTIAFLNEKSETSCKLMLETGRGQLFLKQIPWYCDDLRHIRFSHCLTNKWIDAGIPLPRLLSCSDGASWIDIDGMRFVLMEYVSGRPYSGAITDDRAAALVLGQMHKVGRDFDFEISVLPESLCQLLRSHVALARQQPTCSHQFSQSLNFIELHVDRWEHALPELPTYPVHGDFIPWNLAFGNGDVVAVYDLDNCCLDSRLHDIGEAVVAFFLLPYAGRSSRLRREIDLELPVERIKIFLEQYESVIPLLESERFCLPTYVLGAWWECLLLSFIRREQDEVSLRCITELPSVLAEQWKYLDDYRVP